MKKLKDYSEDIYKCTKCGFCQAACPIYQETGLETAVSRGKFTLLNGILTGQVDFSPRMAKYLDMCLGCRACYDFCPSGISAEEIITVARRENIEKNGIMPLKRFIIWCFKSNTRLLLLKLALDIYKKLNLAGLTRKLCRVLPVAEKHVTIFNRQLEENIEYTDLAPVKEKSPLKIVYFPGCIGNYVNPSSKNAVRMVLEKNGYNVEIPRNFSCCGISSRSAGDFVTFRELAEKNIKQIPDDIDYVLTDCASCGSAWDFYAEVLTGELGEKARIISQKAINIYEFLDKTGVYIPDNASVEETVTYHDPCHLARFQKVSQSPRNLLKKIPGIKYKELEEADKCCGAAGTFCVVKPGISSLISKRKASNILKTGAEIVSTSCSACKIGIAQGLADFKDDKKLLSPIELLAMLYKQEKLNNTSY